MQSRRLFRFFSLAIIDDEFFERFLGNCEIIREKGISPPLQKLSRPLTLNKRLLRRRLILTEKQSRYRHRDDEQREQTEFHR